MVYFIYTPFFISNTFIINTRLKLTKNQAKVKQHPEAELWLFEIYSSSSFMLSPKANMRYSKNVTKTSVSVLMRLCDYNKNEAVNEK